MIYVYLLPKTFLEKLNYQARKRLQYIACDEIRYGAGVVECTWTTPEMADRCRTIRMDHVLEIFWDGGYRKALADVKKEHTERMAGTLAPLIVAPTNPISEVEAQDGASVTAPTLPPDSHIYG